MIVADERLCDALQQYEKKNHIQEMIAFLSTLYKRHLEISEQQKEQTTTTMTTATTTTKQEKQEPFLAYIASTVHRRVLIIRYLFITNFLRLKFNKSS